MQVTVTIDRPMGSFHPQHKNLYYPINYGYIEGIIGGDGEYQDAYVIGVDIPLSHFTGKVIALFIVSMIMKINGLLLLYQKPIQKKK